MRLALVIFGFFVLAAGMSSCSVPFYWQAVSGQLELLRKREPFAEVIADPAVTSEVKTALGHIATIRTFAIDTLLLPDNGSYTTYADLERDYVVWNVVATPEFSIEPEQWCFPFAGCVSYRGFFDRRRAEKFQQRLVDEQFDTYSSGSSAYSTLGYFADPVLNTMVDSRAEALAALLIHELAHQRLYVAGDSELSEAFASTVEEYGTRRWLQERADTEALARYSARLAERAVFAELVSAQQQRLAEIYAASGLADAMRVAKSTAFAQMQKDYASERDAGRISDAYDPWFAQPLNNATLAAVATYRRWVPALRHRLQSVGLEAFYADVEALAEHDAEARLVALDAWDAAAITATTQ